MNSTLSGVLEKINQLDDMILKSLKNISSMTVGVFLSSLVFCFLTKSFVVYILTKISVVFETQFPNQNYIAWGVVVILYGLSLPYLWTFTEANYAKILISVLPNFEETPDLENVGQIVRPKKQKVVLEGLSGIWPWLKQDGEPIHLTKKPLEIPVEAESADNIPIEVKIVATMSPIPGKDLIWYRRSDDETAANIYKAAIRLRVEKLIREGQSDKIRSDPEGFFGKKEDGSGLEDLFKGDTLDEKEKETGRIVYDIKADSVNVNAVTLNLLRAKANADTIKTILEVVIPPCNGNAILEQEVSRIALASSNAPASTTLNIVSGKKGKTP